MVKFEKQENGEYKVVYDNGVYMGDISRAHDLYYNFWPYLAHGGFWPTHVLKDICNQLDGLNAPIDKEFEEYCELEAQLNDPPVDTCF